MTVEMKEEFTQDYAGEMALECEKLEAVLIAGLEEYDHSALAMGKNWYSVALENNESDKQADSSNKRNIVLRIIDGIVNFIKMIGKKIVEWYQACKAAILKFFGKDQIDPVLIGKRFNILVEGMSEKDIGEMVDKLSEETKDLLAEIIDPHYNRAFTALFKDHDDVTHRVNTVDGFCKSWQFFSEFREKAHELKTLSQDSRLADSADKKVKSFLMDSGNDACIRAVSDMFTSVQASHALLTRKCENLLSQVPKVEQFPMYGDDEEAKRRDVLKMISDLLKIDSEVVMKTNHYMQAVSVLMTSIVKYRSKKVFYIPM